MVRAFTVKRRLHESVCEEQILLFGLDPRKVSDFFPRFIRLAALTDHLGL